MNIVLRALGNKNNLLSLEETKLNNKKKFIVIFNFGDIHECLGQDVCSMYNVSFKKIKSKINKCDIKHIIFQGKFYFESEYDATIAMNKIKDDFAIKTVEGDLDWLTVNRFLERGAAFPDIDMDGIASGQTIRDAIRTLTNVGFTHAHATAYSSAALVTRNMNSYSSEALASAILASSFDGFRPGELVLPQIESRMPSIRGRRSEGIMMVDTEMDWAQYAESIRRRE